MYRYRAFKGRQSRSVGNRVNVRPMKRVLPLGAIILIGCGGSSEQAGDAGPQPGADAQQQPPERHTGDFLAPGPHGIGLHTYTFVDTTRPTPPNGTYAGASSRTLVVSVWYPATTQASAGAVTDAPLDHDGGPFPLVLHSHGFMDSRD